MTRDISDTLTVDPRIQQSGITITNLRFELDDSDDLGRYDLHIAMRVPNGAWPEGEFRLQEYSQDGLMVDESSLFPRTTLDPDVRHVWRPSFKAKGPSRFDLIFEPEQPTHEWPNITTEPDWEPVPVGANVADEERLNLTVTGLAAEMRPHFDYANLTIVQVSGQIACQGELPPGLSVQLTALGGDGEVRGTHQIDLSRGPFDVRTFSEMLTVYRHHTVAEVQVRLFSD